MALIGDAGLHSEEFLARQRDRLSEERKARSLVVDSLAEEIDSHLKRGESGELPVEGYGTTETASVELDRARDQHANALARLAEVDAAFARMEQGTYGLCERCGEPISTERLEALPTATQCVACKAM